MQLTIQLLILTSVIVITEQKCKIADRLNPPCYTKNIRGLNIQHLFCQCIKCDEAEKKACSVGRINKGSDGMYPVCPYGECVTCLPVGTTCGPGSSRCCDGVLSLSTEPTYKGYCRKYLASNKPARCAYCALNGELCGRKGPALPCCDKLDSPKSSIKCTKTADNEYRCSENPCKNAGNFLCRNAPKNFRFCKCPSLSAGDLSFRQCGEGVGVECLPCELPGQPCKTRKDCCQTDQSQKSKGQRPASPLMTDCIKGTCQQCFGDQEPGNNHLNCMLNSTIPCCRDDDGDVTECTESPSYGYVCEA